jgi:hypothetical protein
MPILERLSYVYDWLWTHWTEDERRRYRASLQIRGQEVMLRYRRVAYSAKPINNPLGRQFGFLGAAGLAFLGEIPEAETWIDFVLRMLATRYPAASWGSNDGGWANGLAYWAAYMQFLQTFIAAAGEVGIDLMSSPYYRNTGYFAVYHMPPYAPRGGFGDGADGKPSAEHKQVTEALGRVAGDPMLCAYADAIRVAALAPRQQLAQKDQPDPARRWNAWLMDDVFHALLSVNRGGRACGDLRQLPAARAFPACGWVSMHTAIGDAKRDAWLQFKSGPYGSVSHSHADQNSFTLNAHGEPLLIDSGYYPWYGSPHDVLWSRQTWAHNALLVDGHGQPPYDWFARGKIDAFAELAPFAYARGEAAAAYKRPASKEAVEMAERHVPRLIKQMGPATEVMRASRSVLMVNGACPFFVLLDWMEAADAVRFQWLAHALQRMEPDAALPGFSLCGDQAGLTVRFVTPARLRFSQTDKFAKAPEGRAKGSPNQWHLTAETLNPARTARFMAVLVPRRRKDCVPEIEVIRARAAIGVRIGDARVLAPVAGQVGVISHDGIEARGALVAFCGDRLLAAEATRLTRHGRVLLDAPEPQTRVVAI